MNKILSQEESCKFQSNHTTNLLVISRVIDTMVMTSNESCQFMRELASSPVDRHIQYLVYSPTNKEYQFLVMFDLQG